MSTDNDCLPEIVPYVGRVLHSPWSLIDRQQALAVLASLPSPRQTR